MYPGTDDIDLTASARSKKECSRDAKAELREWRFTRRPIIDISPSATIAKSCFFSHPVVCAKWPFASALFGVQRRKVNIGLQYFG